jgi:hypothetical protein
MKTSGCAGVYYHVSQRTYALSLCELDFPGSEPSNPSAFASRDSGG